MLKWSMKVVEPHHDGSPLYVSNSAPKIGQEVTLRIRIPLGYGADSVYLRIYQDGEARTLPMQLASENEHESWWSITLEVINPKHLYRFAVVNGQHYSWLTAAGIRNFEPNSATDFVLIAKPAYGSWIARSVFYQIFPDRFATSGTPRALPSWAVKRDWDQAPEGDGPNTSREYYGGDFSGIQSKLDYINALGVTGLYFTPIFPAGSSHRYDATTFDCVDPLLGGDKEFLHFLKEARRTDLKVMTDLTTNHVGAGHDWFVRAKKDKRSKERQYFYWDKRISFGYVGWWDLASLPKLNFSSSALRKALYESKKSALQRWLRAPYKLDGWRIDVGNMSGRYREHDVHDEVVAEIRASFDAVDPNGWLVAENADMIPEDLDGTSWHGTMNYLGFAKPLWGWINHNPEVRPGGQGFATGMPKLGTNEFVSSLREYNGGIPWRSLMASMNLLGSHDTARMRNVVGGDRELHIAAMALLLTYPGVPTIFAGDEIGLEGAWGEDARRTMPWSKTESWDNEFLEATKRLIAIRKESEALMIGGLRFLEVADDHFLFARELVDSSYVILISRVPLETFTSPTEFGFNDGEVLFASTCVRIWSCR